MRNSSRQDLGVYEFGAEDEDVERAARRSLSMYGKRRGSPKAEANPLDKYIFLQCFAPDMDQGKCGTSDVFCVDSDGSDGGAGEDARNPGKEEAVERDCGAIERTPVSVGEEILVSSTSSGVKGQRFEDKCDSSAVRVCLGEELPVAGESNHAVAAEGSKRFDCDLSSVPCDEEHVVADSEDGYYNNHGDTWIGHSNDDDDKEDIWTSSSSPRSTSDNAENECTFDQIEPVVYSSGYQEMDIDTEVSVSANYILYGDEFYGESQLTFLSDSIRIECSDASGRTKPFVSEWAIANLLLINCRWVQNVETAWVEVQSKSFDVNAAPEGNDAYRTTKLVFTVFGLQWLRKEKKIISLAPKYKDVWRTGYDAIVPLDNVVGSVPSNLRHCISDSEETIEDIVYPIGDPDAVSISRRDIELLKPETFINDTLIDFYIKYLKDRINPEEVCRFHFFNSFFFRKLADLEKDNGHVLKGREAFLRVRKWTRKINIFGKDYIFIPVNFNLHWSLLVICHPGEIVKFEEKEIDECCKVPCILHMDSIKGNHNGLKDHIQSYLWEEWKERQPESTEGDFSKFSNLRFIPLELPQQENMYDCGLFLLHYVELFLKEVPVDFNPFKIRTFSQFLNTDWFIPAEASYKRFWIRDLLYDLSRKKSLINHAIPRSSALETSVSSPSDSGKAYTLDLLSSQCYRTPIDLGSLGKSSVDGGLLQQLVGSVPESVQCEKNDVFHSFQILEPKGVAVSSFDQCNYTRKQFPLIFKKPQFSMSPIEEEAEQFVDTEIDDLQPVNGNMSSEICSTSYSSIEVAAFESEQNQEVSTQFGNHEIGGSTFDMLNSSFTKSEVDADRSLHQAEEHHINDQNDKAKKLKFVPTEGEHAPGGPSSLPTKPTLETCIVEGSQEADGMKEDAKQISLTENRDPEGRPYLPNSRETPETCIVEDSEVDSDSEGTNRGESPLSHQCSDFVSSDSSAADGDAEVDGDDDLVVVLELQPHKRKKHSKCETRRIRTRGFLRSSCS